MLPPTTETIQRTPPPPTDLEGRSHEHFLPYPDGTEWHKPDRTLWQTSTTPIPTTPSRQVQQTKAITFTNFVTSAACARRQSAKTRRSSTGTSHTDCLACRASRTSNSTLSTALPGHMTNDGQLAAMTTTWKTRRPQRIHGTQLITSMMVRTST